MGKLFAYVRQELGRPKEENGVGVDTSALIWGIFMIVSMKAALHLGKDYEEHLCVTRNTEFSEIRLLFPIAEKLVLDQQDEIFGVSTIDWDQTPWMKSTLVHEHVVKLSTA